MDFLNSILQLLNKPFPEQESKLDYLKLLTYFSLFVTFFLLIFQPFGISDIESNKFWICLGFGSMTFLGAVVYELTVGQLFKVLGVRQPWTFYKWILYNLGTMLVISLFNFLFIRLAFFGYIKWELFPVMLYGTFMIGIIPFVVLGWIILNRQEHKFQHISEEINQKQLPQTAPSTAKNADGITIFEIPVNQIRYVEALQNYIKIGYLSATGKMTEQVERATLKYVAEQAKGTNIVRCHRSFMVNQAAIISTAGNAQGLLLTLADCEKVIPVSRSRVADFR